MSGSLSTSDVSLLLSDGSESTRATIAAKVAEQFSNSSLTPRELALAQDILGLLVQDVSRHVREALSCSLAHIPGAPHDVVVALARDVEEVAMPVLEFSSVLTEEDLIDLVQSGGSSKQCAIARRESVPAPVSDALVKMGDREAIKTLVSNGRAVIGEEALSCVVEIFGDDDEVAEPLGRRADMPALLVEKLIRVASAQIRTYLIEHHNIDAERAQWLEDHTRERSLSDMMDVMNAADMMKLARRLQSEDRLTPSLILRAASLGEMPFVEASFATMAGIPEVRAWKLIHNVGDLGFRALYARTGMPEDFFETFQTILEIFHELSEAHGKRVSRFRRELILRVLEECPLLDREDADFLRQRLSRLSAAA